MDEKHSLEFHIASNDFFGTAATVLDLIRQDLDRRRVRRVHVRVLARMCEHLVHLQGRYRIVREREGKSVT